MNDLEQFYRTSYDKLVGFMSKKVGGHREVAEDIVQEAFSRAVRYLPSYDEERGTLFTWFNSILFNALRDQQSQNKGQNNFVDVEVLSSVDVLSTVSLQQSAEIATIIDQNLRQVPNHHHRRILELFYVMGYNSREISEIEEGVSQSNVTTVVMRFRDKMKKGSQ